MLMHVQAKGYRNILKPRGRSLPFTLSDAFLKLISLSYVLHDFSSYYILKFQCQIAFIFCDVDAMSVL